MVEATASAVNDSTPDSATPACFPVAPIRPAFRSRIDTLTGTGVFEVAGSAPTSLSVNKQRTAYPK
jgi:hypothetical protein